MKNHDQVLIETKTCWYFEPNQKLKSYSVKCHTSSGFGTERKWKNVISFQLLSALGAVVKIWSGEWASTLVDWRKELQIEDRFLKAGVIGRDETGDYHYISFRNDWQLNIKER